MTFSGTGTWISSGRFPPSSLPCISSPALQRLGLRENHNGPCVSPCLSLCVHLEGFSFFLPLLKQLSPRTPLSVSLFGQKERTQGEPSGDCDSRAGGEPGLFAVSRGAHDAQCMPFAEDAPTWKWSICKAGQRMGKRSALPPSLLCLTPPPRILFIFLIFPSSALPFQPHMSPSYFLGPRVKLDGGVSCLGCQDT